MLMTSRSGHPKVTAAMPSSVIPNDLREKKNQNTINNTEESQRYKVS